MILLDTNVLVYATFALSEQHEDSKRVVDGVIEGQLAGAIVPQILVEFVAATTGPAVATPLSVTDAIAQVAAFRAQIRVLVPPVESLRELEEIVVSAGRAGRRTFDYYLAAQARALGTTTICTYNRGDFSGISGITTVSPADIHLTEGL